MGNQAPPSAIWNLQVDSPIVQDASFRQNATDRAFIDSQIRGMQQHLVQSVIGGVHATWRTLDAGSAAGSAGDCVVLSGSTAGTVTRVTAATLAAAGRVFGVLLQGAAPGGQVPIAVDGVLSPSVTGLAATSGFARVNLSTARIERVAGIGSADLGMGSIDAAGNLKLSIALHRSQVFNVKDFGAVGDGTTDDTTAIQNAINAALASGHVATVYFPYGTYKITATLNVIGTLVAPVGVNLKGDGSVATAGTPGTVIRWSGAALQPMLIKRDVTECTDEDIMWDGNATALTTVFQKPSSSGLRYNRSVFSNTKVIPYWTAGMSVSTITPTYCLTPGTSSAYPDNHHLYLCTNSGSGTTAGTPTTFPTTAGGFSAADANGVVWQEVGPSPAAFLVGDLVFPEGNSQAADTRWTECLFGGGISGTIDVPTGGGAGWRALSGGNVKDFSLYKCFYQNSAIGLDWEKGSGFCDSPGTEWAGNGLDTRQSGGLLRATGSSENSGMMLFGNLGGQAFAHCDLTGVSWIGRTHGAGAPCIKWGGQASTLKLGCFIQDQNTLNNFPIIQCGASASVQSRGTTFIYKAAYTGPFFFPIYDTAGGSLNPASGAWGTTYVTTPTPWSSEGDTMQNDAGANNVALPRVVGDDFAVAHQQIYANASLQVSGVSTTKYGTMAGAYAVYTVNFAAPKAFTTTPLVLARPQNGTFVKSVHVFIDQAFDQAGTTVSIGKIFQTGGTTTANAFLLAADVHTATTNTSGAPIGSASGDLGADLSGAVQGGHLYWGTAGATGTWEIIAVFGGAGLASLGAGSLRVVVRYENLF